MKVIHYLASLFLAFLFIVAIFLPEFSHYTCYETHLEYKNTPPCLLFLCGTDNLGRDILTRLAFGARLSLLIGISAAFIETVIGVLWGAAAGLFGGILDEVMMRISDVFYAIPYLLKVILIMTLLEPGFFSLLLALSLSGWIDMARIVRGQIIQLKEQDFVLGAIALGAGRIRLLFRHLLPNALQPILIKSTLAISTAIFTESFLSFLGLGLQAQFSSWGSMISEGLPAMMYYPWRLLFPATLITLTLFSFNILAEKRSC